MNLRRQNGSATVIIIIVLVIALLGVLGYVFLGKFSQASQSGSDSKTVEPTKTTAPNEKFETASFDKSFGIDMHFKYPKTWKIEKDHSGAFPVSANDSSIESFTLISPDKEYSVVYRLGAGGGIGGTCDDESAATIVAADSKDVDGWSGVKYVLAVTKTQSGKYVSKASLVSASTVQNLKIGGSACEFGLGVTAVPSMDLGLTLLDASVHGSKDMNIVYGTSNQGEKSESDARQLFSGSSYDEAKAILLSTTLK